MTNPSLILQPARQKAGTLYGYSNGEIVPFEVIRATPRTRVNANGLLESIGNDLATFDYTDGNCPAFSPWEQRTNLVQRSQEFDNAYWTPTGATISADAAVAPDGTTTMDRLTETATNGIHIVNSSVITTSGNDARAGSLFVKKGNVRYIQLISFFSGTSQASAIFDLDTETVTDTRVDSSSGPIFTFIDAGFDYDENGNLRLFLITSTTSLVTTFLIAHSNVATFAAATLSEGIVSYAGNASSFTDIWGAQVEIGDSASPYIPTTASAVTRNAEVIRNTSATAYIGATQGAIAGRFIAGTNAGHIVDISTGSTNNSIQIDYGNAGAGILRATVFTSGVPHTIISTTALSAGSHGFCFTYESGNFALYVDGALVGTNTAAFLPIGLDEIYIGSNIGTSSWFNGSIPYLWFFNTLPDNPANESTK